MRKFAIWMILILFLLNSCQRRRDFSLEQPEDQVVAIEIICILTWSGYDPENENTFEVQRTIDPVQYDTFLQKLYDVPCYRYFNDPLEGVGKNTIRVSFSDGSYQLIGEDTVYYETSIGDWEYPRYYFDKEAFDAFLSDFT